MSRFTTSTKQSTITKNHEGAKAYKLSPEMELYTLVCTFALQPKYYESNKTQLERLRSLMGQVSPLFAAKLAIYAREQMYLRTVPVMMAVELAKIHTGDDIVSRLVERIVQRADEITELFGYYAFSNNRTGTKKLNKISNQIRKGVKNIFESGRFTEYHFGKYNRKTDVRFRDALFLTHPKPKTEEQRELFSKIVSDTLETPYTWETQLSEAGKADSPATTKKAVWEELIDSGKVGYMALLRNLRNIIQADVSQEHFDKVCARIADAEQVRKSKQFPFRFLSAYRMLVQTPRTGWGYTNEGSFGDLKKSYVNQVVKALESAITASAENLPYFDNSLFAIDVSGSMMRPVSERSVVESYDIGTVLCMMAQSRSSHCITGMFGDTWKVLDFPKENILHNANLIRKREGEVGYSTNGWKVIKWLNDNDINVDNIYIFTDCQLYGGDIIKEWNIFKKNNPKANLIMFDLGGYGITPLDIRDNSVFLIGGWSDKVFDVLSDIIKGEETLNIIDKVDF